MPDHDLQPGLTVSTAQLFQRRADEQAAYEDTTWPDPRAWRRIFRQRGRERDEENPPAYAAPDEKRRTSTRHSVRRKPSVLSARSTLQSSARSRSAQSPQLAYTDGRWHGQKHEFETSRLSTRLLYVAKPNLVWPIRTPDRKHVHKYIVSVATMQSVVVRTYQRDLIQAAKEMMSGKMSVLLPQLVHRYCKAVRDMDYMQQAVTKGFDSDPFLLQSNKQLEREMMQHYHLLPRHKHLPRARDRSRPRLPGIGRRARLEREHGQLKAKKRWYALFGAFSLLFPMTIMRIVPGIICALVTTSVSVLVFATVAASRESLRPQEILAAVAAYAAVLVVFVGTSSTS